jgi:hypothetical protein
VGAGQGGAHVDLWTLELGFFFFFFFLDEIAIGLVDFEPPNLSFSYLLPSTIHHGAFVVNC